MSALTWREWTLGRDDRFQCQAEGCLKNQNVRHEPFMAGYRLVPEQRLSDRFLLCRACRVRWEQLWVEMGGSE